MVVCIRYTRHRCMCCAHVQCDVYNVCTSCIIVLLSHYRLSPRGGRYYRGVGFLVRECIAEEVEFIRDVRYEESEGTRWEREISFVLMLCVYAN